MNRATDPDRFEALVRDHSAAAWRAAQRVLLDGERAADVVQELYLRVLDGRLDLAEAEEPGLVLGSWATRLALGQRRGEVRRRKREERHAMEKEASGMENEAEREDEHRALWKHLTALPEELRLALVLRYREGLTFAAIGAAVGCAEPTAHDRVRRGLERLRAALAGAGLAAVVARVEDRLGQVEPGEAPAGLAERLLALGARPAAAVSPAAGGWFPGVALAGALAATALVVLGPLLNERPAPGPGLRPGERPGRVAAERAPAGRAVPDGGGGRAAVGAAATADRDAAENAQDPVATPAARVQGRAVDGDGLPVPDATVALESVERRGKFPAWSGFARTDAAGRYALEVPVPEGAAHRTVRVRASRLDRGAGLDGPRRAAAGETTDLGDLVFASAPAVEEGPFTLELLVVGPRGEPVPGARLTLHHQSPREVRFPGVGGGAPRWYDAAGWVRAQDATAESDGAGLALLRGGRLGPKLLIVQPADPAWAPVELELPVPEPGYRALRVALEAGGVVEGRVTDLRGERPEGVHLWLVPPGNGGWVPVQLDAGGGFLAEGLGRIAYTLRVDSRGPDPWSPVGLPVDLTAEPEVRDLALTLKRADDPRDVGHHGAELHGRVVDAATGEGVPLDRWDVAEFTVPARDGYDLERDLMPNHLFPPPVQREVMLGAVEPVPSPDFHLVGLLPGTRVVYVNVRGYGQTSVGPFELGPRTLIADVEVRLRPPAELAVEVVDADGAPVEGALVFPSGSGPYSDGVIERVDREWLEADGRGTHYAWGGATGADGRVLLRRLPAGRLFAPVAVHPGHEPARGELAALEPGETRVTLVLREPRRR